MVCCAAMSLVAAGGVRFGMTHWREALEGESLRTDQLIWEPPDRA